MTRILRVKSITSPATPKKTGTGGQDAIEKSLHDPSVLTGKTTSKRSVKRLIARNPVNDPLSMNEVVDQFSNNPNPKFDNSKAPGAVSVKKFQRGKVGTGRQNHGKVIPPNKITRFGGKNLRRY
jgi:hypothetical protein